MEWKTFGSVRLFDAPLIPIHVVIDGRCSCGQHPCERSSGKHPRTLHGFYDATREENQINRWISQFPQTNWAIATGQISNICILDIDPRNGGVDSFNKAFPNGLPETFTVRTGGLGYHNYWLYDPVFGRTEKNFLPGLDFLANAAYALVPPSSHESGRFYETYLDVPIQPIPEELKAYLRRQREQPETNIDMDWGEAITEGGRNTKLAQLAGKLFWVGLKLPTVYATLLNHNQQFCLPPLEREEVKSICKSIEATDARKKAAKVEAENQKKREQEGVKRPAVKFATINYLAALSKYGDRNFEWLIEGWLPQRTTGFIQAPPGSWKSWFVYMMGYAIASGQPLFGDPKYKVHRQGSVYHMNQEDDPSILLERLSMIARVNDAKVKGIDLGTETEREYNKLREKENWMYLDASFDAQVIPDLPIFIHHAENEFGEPVPAQILNFTDLESVHAFERDVVKPGNHRLHTLDPLYTFVPAKDNFVEAPAHLLIIKEWARKYDTSFMIVHHMNKGKTGTRMRDNILGSQLLNAFQETSISFDNVPGIDSAVYCERSTKANGFYGRVKMNFFFDDVGVNSVDVMEMKPKDQPKEKPKEKPDTKALDQKTKEDEILIRYLQKCAVDKIYFESKAKFHKACLEAELPVLKNETAFGKRCDALGIDKDKELGYLVYRGIEDQWYDAELDVRDTVSWNGTGKRPRV